MVSIVIPTYNRADFLRRAIDSVLKQTLGQWELIVVDDGSQVPARQTISGFSDDRIRLLEQSHRGVSAARNRGIAAARFRWLAFLDSDDQWVAGKLEKQLRTLEADPQYRMVHTDEIWIRNGRRVNPKKIHRKYGGWIYHRCLPLCSISPSSVLVDREILERVGLFDETLTVCEDYDLWLRLCCRFPVRLLDEKLVVKYGGHSDQLSRRFWGMDRFRLKALIKAHRSGQLSAQQEIWTAREIVRKAEILAKGYSNRGKPDEAAHYWRLAQQWAPDPRSDQLPATSA